ncbi:holin [Nonomuraea sp. NPDC050663]|uniref:holin n=1 Tax=Nonomuraea sp. NPDC050663 TaxID=3364370 RepID=UPI0037A8B219
MQKWVTGSFWADTIERTVRTAAQAALATIGGNAIGLFDVDWATVGQISGLAAVVAVITAFAAGSTGDVTNASFRTPRAY